MVIKQESQGQCPRVQIHAWPLKESHTNCVPPLKYFIQVQNSMLLNISILHSKLVQVGEKQL